MNAGSAGIRYILCSSPNGVGAKKFMQAIGDARPDIQVHSLDDELLRILDYADWFAAHEALPFTEIRTRWPEALEQLCAKITSGWALIHAHSVHWNDALQFPFAACDFGALKRCGSCRGVVSLSDDIYESVTAGRFGSMAAWIKDASDKEAASRYSTALEGMLVRRQLDVITCMNLSAALEAPHYLISVRHRPTDVAGLFERLLEGAKAPNTYYFSHNIRAVTSSGRDWKPHAELLNSVPVELSALGDAMFFEPTTIDELLLSGKELRDRWPRDVGGRSFEFTESLEDVTRGFSLKKDEVVGVVAGLQGRIGAQVTWRDLLLVHQSDNFLMWRPFWHGQFSVGALREVEVFAKKGGAGLALIVHEEGDIALWAKAVLEKECTDRHVSIRTSLDGAAARVAEGITAGRVSRDEVVGSLAQSLSVGGGAGQVLREGEAYTGSRVGMKAGALAAEVFAEAFQPFASFLEGLERLTREQRVRQFIGHQLDHPDVAREFVRLHLKPVV